MIHHDEARQVFNRAGLPIPGASISPKDSRETSEIIIGAVHIWIWRKTDSGAEVLLQHRSKDKPTWPDRLDISAAGHIDAGESLIEAVAREAHEEIGAVISEGDLEFIFCYRNFDNGIKWVYLCEQIHDENYSFNDGEVQALQWVSLDTFTHMSEDPERYGLVPHPAEYYSLLNKAMNHFI